MNEHELNPIMMPCPVCASWPTEPCSVPTSNGQRYVKWFHLKREDAARTTKEETDGTTH